MTTLLQAQESASDRQDKRRFERIGCSWRGLARRAALEGGSGKAEG